MKRYSFSISKNNNNTHRSELNNNVLLARAVDVLNSPDYNLEQGLKTLLTSIKYYCNFDFVGYWIYDQHNESFLLNTSSENLSDEKIIYCQLKEQTLPWSINELLSKKYVVSKTNDYSIKSSRKTLKLVREADAHFFLLIPIVINNALFGILTFSNYGSTNAVPSNIEYELKNFSRLLSTTIHKKLLIEEKQKYKDLLNIVSSWKLSLKKPMPIFLQNIQQINWLYKYGVVSTTSKEMAYISGYVNEKAFNEAAVSLNEFMPRKRKGSIKFLMNIINNHHNASKIEFSKIDINNNEYFYRANIESCILSGEVHSLTFQFILYKSSLTDRNNNHLKSIDITVKENLDQLTNRESELLLYVISGSPNKLIADELGISEKTVKAHRGKIMKKLKVCCFAELVRACDHLGLTPKYTSYYSYSDRVA